MTTTELTVFDASTLVPARVFVPGGIDEILSKVERDTRAEAAELDISTAKGREKIKSLAYKVARSKTALDDMGKDLVAEIKAQSSAIDAERRKVRERLDALRDEVRKPLDNYEAAEAARIKAREDGIVNFQMASDFPISFTASEIANRLSMVEGWTTDGFQEFTKRAVDAKTATVSKLRDALGIAQKREAEAAELARLRAEAEARATKEAAERTERERRERESRIAEEARLAAEAKAKREAEEAERRAKAERARIELAAREATEKAERERREAEQRAAKAEADRIEAERQAAEAAEKAESDRLIAENNARIAAEIAARKAEEDRIAAEASAKRREEEAAERERQRIEAERRAKEAAAAKREADIAHRRKINGEAVAALVAAGLSDGAAKAAITAIAKRTVPHVSIAY